MEVGLRGKYMYLKLQGLSLGLGSVSSGCVGCCSVQCWKRDSSYNQEAFSLSIPGKEPKEISKFLSFSNFLSLNK